MVYMVLKGEGIATSFVFSPGMYLQKTLDWWKATGKNPSIFNGSRPEYMGFDFGTHTAWPQFDDQEVVHPTKMRKTGDGPLDIAFDKIGKEPPVCEYIGVPCYCDGSALYADKVMRILVEKGDEAVWRLLEERLNDEIKQRDEKRRPKS